MKKDTVISFIERQARVVGFLCVLISEITLIAYYLLYSEKLNLLQNLGVATLAVYFSTCMVALYELRNIPGYLYFVLTVPAVLWCLFLKFHLGY
mgnify:CR=1 FL=1